MRNITRRLDLNLASFCAGKSANLLIFEGIRARLRSRPAEIYMPGSSRPRPTLFHLLFFSYREIISGSGLFLISEWRILSSRIYFNRRKYKIHDTLSASKFFLS